MTVPEAISRGLATVLASAAVALLPQHAPAHHSAAMYDMSRLVTVHGTVEKYDWRNPHVYIYVEETTEHGERREWEVEALPTTIMQRLGWDAETLRPGDRVEVMGFATRNPRRQGLNPTLIVTDEGILFEQTDSIARLSSAGPTAQTEARSFGGTWATLMNLDLIMAFVTPQFELTPEGAAGVAATTRGVS
jgi:hypothetical protein